jgi:transcriptional regulator with XRE-family HTH domain
MDSPIVFWENVKKEIKQQNTTHEWVAKKAGVSFNTFQGWISKGIFPRADAAVRIALALDTSVEYLVTGTINDTAFAINKIKRHLPKITQHLSAINEAMRDLT